MNITESAWRCPNAKNGAFHVLDLSRSRLQAGHNHYLCTECNQWADAALVETGMASTVNAPPSNPQGHPSHEAVGAGEMGGKAETYISLKKASAPIWALTINAHGNWLVRIGYDGRMEYGPTYTPDKAARSFWEALRAFSPFVSPVEPEPLKPTGPIADLDVFNGSLKTWFRNTYSECIGDVIHSAGAVTAMTGLPLKQVKPCEDGCELPRIHAGLSEPEAQQWCRELISSRFTDVNMRYFARWYPEVSYHETDENPEWGTIAEKFYCLRFRIFVVEESR